MMTKILDRLYVGSSDFTEEGLDAAKITHIINVGGEEVRTDKIYYREHLSDDGDNPHWKFSTVLGRLGDVLSSDSHRVLVCCRAGISRSAFIVILWLERAGMSRDEAYAYVKERHPATQIALDLLRSR